MGGDLRIVVCWERLSERWPFLGVWAIECKEFMGDAEWGWGMHTYRPVLGRQRQADLFEFEARMPHIASSRQPELCSKTLSKKRKQVCEIRWFQFSSWACKLMTIVISVYIPHYLTYFYVQFTCLSLLYSCNHCWYDSVFILPKYTKLACEVYHNFLCFSCEFF